MSKDEIINNVTSGKSFLNNFELDFYLNESVKLSSFDFIKSLLAAAVLGYLINLIYIRYSNPLSNKAHFSKNFIILSVTTCIIITIVKSSLALSLGLVGALSIVRFRAAIKEPEELIYLFLTIAAGLGSGAGQIKLTFFGVLFVLLIIIFQKIFQNNETDDNFTKHTSHLKISISKEGIFNAKDIEKIEKELQYASDFMKFISINSNRDMSIRNYEINIKNKIKLEKTIDKINSEFSDIKILIINNQKII